ncbi:hypothetical protein TEA_014126 [Camellia sinensis var. sinensis]|uniref:NnrU domain-containing protein n=1 Tax=Camellia sinensis var. sinensis TaxID=542762 RepID=A0A4S4DZW4_CAMSN|nr:hypothetical protein TEA_014126 [Camellia sinensis var. sinensis]
MATSLLLSNPISPYSHLPTNKFKTTSKLFTLSNPFKPSQFNSSPFLSSRKQFSSKPLTRILSQIDGPTPRSVLELSDEEEVDDVLVGEDSAEFDFAKQKISSWISFAAVLGIVLLVLDVAWIDSSTGFGKAFIDSVSSISESHEDQESGLVLKIYQYAKWILMFFPLMLMLELHKVTVILFIHAYEGLNFHATYCNSQKDLFMKAEPVNILLQVVMFTLTLIFAVVHSGLASFRDKGEKLIGERAFRVLFAGLSLPLALSTVVYFINHRYDGVQLWQLQSVPGLHQVVWLSNFISFFFLYPSTFNLLEVAAVDKPKMHLWETGIMRITRHPQMVGQVMWCLAHTIWIGNSVAAAASIGLIGHHLFGVWNGDRRLAIRYGEAFDVVKSRTSVIPFAAILDGRQKLPKDYYKEFIRLPYLSITALTLGAYLAHPLMQAASFRLHW